MKRDSRLVVPFFIELDRVRL